MITFLTARLTPILEILIPDEYVESITERLSLYSRLDNCENEKELTGIS